MTFPGSMLGSGMAIILAVMMLGSAGVHAREHYVDNLTTSIQETGSVESPFRQIGSAITRLKAGDSVFIVDNGPTHPYREQLTIADHRYTEAGKVFIGARDNSRPPLIIGSDNWTNSNAAGGRQWREDAAGRWRTDGYKKLRGIWFATRIAWKRDGVHALSIRKQVREGKDPEPGTWWLAKNTGEVVYWPREGERLQDLHIEAVVRPHILFIKNSSHITLQALNMQLSGSTAVITRESCMHLNLKNLEIQHARDAGIKVTGGGGYITIERCIINSVGNNGIKFHGHPSDHVHHTVVRGCKITNVGGNDGITLHKDMAYNDVGDHHLIEGNIIGFCAEQGIDVTSGRHIQLINNTTHDNVISGVGVGHGAKDVTIKGHLSVRDGRRAGIMVKTSDNVILQDSLVIDSPGQQLDLYKSKGFTASNNTFVTLGNNKNPVIRIDQEANGFQFKRNILLSLAKSGLMLRMSGAGDLASRSAGFTDNIWWPGPESGPGGVRIDKKPYRLNDFLNFNGIVGDVIRDPDLNIVMDDDVSVVVPASLHGYGFSAPPGAGLPQ